jgi:hypothetical protein
VDTAGGATKKITWANIKASLKTYFDTLYATVAQANATHTGDATGATALTVVKINGVSLAGLGTGLLKNTTGTGVPSIAVNSDLPTMTATVGGAVPTPPNNTTTFLRGDGTFATPAGSGDMVLASVQSVTGLKTFDASKIAMKGSSTGVTTIATANAGASDYTQTLQAKTGTIANSDDVHYIGTTSVALNRASAPLTLAGITLTTPDIGTPSAGTLTNCTSLPVAGITASTSTALGVGSIELGHASDTTISRVSAGVVAIEGKNILTTDGGTLTGTITLGENTGIALDPAGSADGKWSGITITGTSDYTQAFGDLVYLKAANSRWAATDADASGTGGPVMVGMVVSAGTSGNACTILLQGQIRADAKFPALTIGAPVYLGEAAGEIQVAIPTGADNVIRVVGFALTADEIYFNPSQDHQLTVA